MLIEQIIEFERTCAPTTGCFHDKTKIPKKIFEWIIIYC